MMFIEDLVASIADDDRQISRLPVKDANLIKNIARQLKNGTYLTEGQANLLIKVLKENFFNLTIPNLALFLDLPAFKYKFRVLDTTKKIFLYSDNVIGIKYPFNNKLNNLINSVVGSRYVEFSKKDKSYTVPLTTKNIYELVSSFQTYGFVVDEKIMGWYQEIKKIKSDAESYVPLIDFDNALYLKNTNQVILDYYNSNRRLELVADLFLAKTLGLEFSSIVKEKLDQEDISSLTKTIFKSNKNKFFLSNKKHSISNVVGSMKELHCWPIVIMLEDNNLNGLENWFIDLTNQGIDAKQMSVLFRSTNNKDLNNFIKSKQLNNLVDDNTKVVFVKQKIPKLLFKIPFKPKLLICSTRYYAHYTAAKMVDSHPLVLYYTDQVSNLGNDIAEL